MTPNTTEVLSSRPFSERRSADIASGKLQWLDLEYRNGAGVAMVFKRRDFYLDGVALSDEDGRRLLSGGRQRPADARPPRPRRRH